MTPLPTGHHGCSGTAPPVDPCGLDAARDRPNQGVDVPQSRHHEVDIAVTVFEKSWFDGSHILAEVHCGRGLFTAGYALPHRQNAASKRRTQAPVRTPFTGLETAGKLGLRPALL